MTTSTISDAVVSPQSPGTGIADGDNDVISAATAALQSRYQEGTYVDDGLAFANVDTTNEQVDVTSGITFIEDDLSDTSNERGSGGSPQVQSTRNSGYDTEVPTNHAYLVIVPTDQTNLQLDTDATNDVYLSVDPTQQNSVTLHFGSGISAPSDPSVKLGTVNTSDGSTTRPNDDEAVTRRSVDTDELVGASERVAREGYWREEKVADLDHLFTTTSGSGAVANNSWKLNLTTGTTGDSHARAREMLDIPVPTRTRFNTDFICVINPFFSTIGSASGDKMFVAFGDEPSEDTYTSEHVGIGVDGGDLVASSGDGSTQETTVQTASVGTGSQPCYIEWVSSVPEANYYFAADPDFSSPDVTHSTNIPPALNNNLRRFTMIVDNDSNANQNELDVSQYKVGSE